VRAVRHADDGTVAGILISNTLNEPVLQLFSVPAMSDARRALLHHVRQAATSRAASWARASASALGMQGGTALAQSLAGQMGLGEASVESTGGMQEASLFLGTYLSPRLYMAYGIGLFEDVTRSGCATRSRAAGRSSRERQGAERDHPVPREKWSQRRGLPLARHAAAAQARAPGHARIAGHGRRGPRHGDGDPRRPRPPLPALVGPCSIHDVGAAREYAARLAPLR
jgi:hypothetical protein